MQLEDSRAPALHRGENPHTWSWCLLRPSPVPLLCSCVVELLRLCVQGCALLDRGESRDLQGLARLCASLHPWVLLAQRALLLAHNLAVLVLGQVLSSQATNGLGLASAEHHGIGHATPSNLAHALLLHCLHGLHGCFLLHDLHGLHGCLLLHHLHGLHGCLLLHHLHGLHGRLLLHHLHGLHGCLLLHHLHGLHRGLLLHHLWRRCCLHGLHCLGHSDEGGLRRCVRRRTCVAARGQLE